MSTVLTPHLVMSIYTLVLGDKLGVKFGNIEKGRIYYEKKKKLTKDNRL
jgi:hypothetical protein